MKHQTDTIKKEPSGFMISRGKTDLLVAYIGGSVGIAGLAILLFTFFSRENGESTDILTIIGLLSVCASILVFVFAHNALYKQWKLSDQISSIMRAKSERYVRAASGSHEGLWDIDTETGVAFFSEGWHRMLGLLPDTVHTMEEWTSRMHPSDRAAAKEILDAHMRGTRPYYESEYRIQNAHGTYIWISDRGSRTGDVPNHIAGFSRDITREKRVEEALQSRSTELRKAKDLIEKEVLNTRKFSQAVEATSDPISIITASGNIMYTNTARATLFRTARTDMVGSHFLSPYREKTDKSEVVAFELSLRAGNPFSSENFVGVRADGTEFEAALSLFPVREKGSVSFFTILEQDITKRKDIDRAKTEFVSLASHQLRTPLTAIRWYSEILLREKEHPFTDSERKYLREIYEANRRMIELINALLNVSRIDLGSFSVSPKPIDIAALMESVIGEIGPQVITKRLAIDKNISGTLPLVLVDPQLIRIVFQNLLSNAAKYTATGGHISVGLAQNGDTILFTVADAGIGIPAAQRSHIFSKLFRAENARDVDPDGTGLGLYIVKAIMEASGGTIRFESEEGVGTTFYGTIPIQGSRGRSGNHTLNQ